MFRVASPRPAPAILAAAHANRARLDSCCCSRSLTISTGGFRLPPEDKMHLPRPLPAFFSWLFPAAVFAQLAAVPASLNVGPNVNINRQSGYQAEEAIA